MENARIRGEQLLAGLLEIQARSSRVIGNVRGLGLMQGIEFTDRRRDARRRDRRGRPAGCITEQGLLTLTCGPAGNVVRLIPALVVTDDEIATGLERFEAALAAVAGAVRPRPRLPTTSASTESR